METPAASPAGEVAVLLYARWAQTCPSSVWTPSCAAVFEMVGARSLFSGSAVSRGGLCGPDAADKMDGEIRSACVGDVEGAGGWLG